MKDCIVKPLTANDSFEIRKIARLSWMWTYRDIYTESFIEDWIRKNYDTEKIKDDIARTHPGGDIIFYGSFIDNRLTGFIETKITGVEAEILRLYVLPDHTRMGIGTKLMDETEKILLLRGVSSVKLYVHRMNTVGIGFYMKRMFRESEIDGDDIKMEKYLVPRVYKP
ncbi:MAG: GNAT family N-acetyltransferase [Thermoplasmata archaeon]